MKNLILQALVKLAFYVAKHPDQVKAVVEAIHAARSKKGS
jgi:hypothetical protein